MSCQIERFTAGLAAGWRATAWTAGRLAKLMLWSLGVCAASIVAWFALSVVGPPNIAAADGMIDVSPVGDPGLAPDAGGGPPPPDAGGGPPPDAGGAPPPDPNAGSPAPPPGDQAAPPDNIVGGGPDAPVFDTGAASGAVDNTSAGTGLGDAPTAPPAPDLSDPLVAGALGGQQNADALNGLVNGIRADGNAPGSPPPSQPGTVTYSDGSSATTGAPDPLTGDVTQQNYHPAAPGQTDGAPGSTIVYHPDGSLTTTDQGGTTTRTRADGTVEIASPNGYTATTPPNGLTSVTDPNGNTTLVAAGNVPRTNAIGSAVGKDGSISSVSTMDQTMITRFPDGSTQTTFRDGTTTVTPSSQNPTGPSLADIRTRDQGIGPAPARNDPSSVLTNPADRRRAMDQANRLADSYCQGAGGCTPSEQAVVAHDQLARATRNVQAAAAMRGVAQAPRQARPGTTAQPGTEAKSRTATQPGSPARRAGTTKPRGASGSGGSGSGGSGSGGSGSGGSGSRGTAKPASATGKPARTSSASKQPTHSNPVRRPTPRVRTTPAHRPNPRRGTIPVRRPTPVAHTNPVRSIPVRSAAARSPISVSISMPGATVTWNGSSRNAPVITRTTTEAPPAH